MKPLIVLITVFIIATAIIKLGRGQYDIALAGRIAMSVMLVFTALAHYQYARGMSMMIPEFIPYKLEIVYMTGIIEIAAAIGLLVPNFKLITAWLLIAFFVLILPANIYAAIHKVDYLNATLNGKGPGYLWFRVPLQIFFILWVYFSAVHTNN